MDLLVSSAMEVDSSLPSFFEMFMTQQVEQSLKPAVRHAHGALATRWPGLHRISPWFEETYLLLTLLVEARFLASNSCLLSESFYGLRRCRYGPKKGPPAPSGPAEDAHFAFERNGAGYGPGQRLRARDRRKALLIAAVLPYLLAKLDAGHERYGGSPTRDRGPSGRGQSVQGTAEAGVTGRGRVWDGGGLSGLGASVRSAQAAARRRLITLCSLFFQVYPLLRASYEGSCLVYQWLYLFRRSAFFSPTLRLTGMVVRRATVEDWEEDNVIAMAAAAESANAISERNCTPGFEAMSGKLRSLGERVARYGKVLLVAAIVGFKIVEWWTRVESQEGSSWRRAQLPQPPPPPRPPQPVPGGCGVPTDPEACPACGGLRVNPALCMVSGFVFCYRCLSRHVREHRECPVTGLACGERDVVRLFDDEDVG